MKPRIEATPLVELPQRFFDKVRLDGSCWMWTGCTTNGYGRFNFRGIMRVAHVLAYESYFGAIPEGLQLDHLCRNRACVNPTHVEPVTHLENARRGLTGPKCMHGRKHRKSNGGCRPCQAVYMREYKRRQREAPK